MTKINRRSFLKRSSILATFLCPFTAKGQQSSSRQGLDWGQWKSIVEYARWCPTVHNLQPHKLKIISSTTAELYYDTSRLLPVGDPEMVFSRVALGVFIENLSIAAAPYGKCITVTKLIEDTNPKKGLVHFANLKVCNSLSTTEIDRELILQRRTSRGKYKKKAIRTSTFQKVQQEAQRFNHHFQTSSDPDFVKFMVNINQKTLFEDLENDPLREELNQLFRYDEKSARNKKDGLSAQCMGFPGKLMRSVFQQHEKWTKGLRKKILRKRYKKTFKGTQSLGWFSGKFQTTEDFVQAGRMLARAWLKITEDGAYLQPFGSLITNKSAYQQIKQNLNIPAGDEQLWLIFRLGYSKTPARSERLDLDTILLNDSKPLSL